MRFKIFFFNVDAGGTFQCMWQGIPQSGGSNSENAASPALPRVLGTTRELLHPSDITIEQNNTRSHSISLYMYYNKQQLGANTISEHKEKS